ncbi:hypothetical protein MRX96_018651 [Rhipicephalus microplus]
MRPLLMSSKTLSRRSSFLDICEIDEKKRRQTYYEEESQRELLGCEEPGGHVDAVTGFAKPPIRLESEVRGALTREEQAGNIDAVTGSNKPPGSLESGDGELQSVKNRPGTSTPSLAPTSLLAAWNMESVELQPVKNR